MVSLLTFILNCLDSLKYLSEPSLEVSGRKQEIRGGSFTSKLCYLPHHDLGKLPNTQG